MVLSFMVCVLIILIHDPCSWPCDLAGFLAAGLMQLVGMCEVKKAAGVWKIPRNTVSVDSSLVQ